MTEKQKQQKKSAQKILLVKWLKALTVVAKQRFLILKKIK